MANKWVQHIKQWAAEHNTSYGCALTDPKCRESYVPMEKKTKTKSKPVMTEAKRKFKTAMKKNIEIPQMGEIPTVAELKKKYTPKNKKVPEKEKPTSPNILDIDAIQTDLLKKSLREFYFQTKLQSPNLDNLDFEQLNKIATDLTQDDTDYKIRFNTIMLKAVVREYTTPNIPMAKKDFLERLKNRVKATLQKDKEDAGRPQAGDEYEQSGVEIDNSPAGKKENKHIKLIEGKMKTALNYTSDDFSNYLKKIEEMTNKYGPEMTNVIKLSILNKISINEAIQILDKLRGDNKYMNLAKEKKIKISIPKKELGETLLLTYFKKPKSEAKQKFKAALSRNIQIPEISGFPTTSELRAELAPKKKSTSKKQISTTISELKTKKFNPPKNWIAIKTNNPENILDYGQISYLDGFNGKILFYRTKTDLKRFLSTLRRAFANVEASSDKDPYSLISMIEDLGIDKSGLNIKGGALIGRQPYVEGGCMMCGGALIGRQPYVEGGKMTGKKFVKGLKNVGKQTASALLHYALPATLGVAGEMLGGPAGAVAMGTLGEVAAEKIGNKTGYGLMNRKGRPLKMNIDYLSTSRGNFV